MNGEGREKFFVFEDIRYDGGSLKAYDSFEEAKKHISDDTEYIVKGKIVWCVNEPHAFPAKLRIGKFYKTRAGNKALFVWQERWSNEPGKPCHLCFVEQLNGRIIRTLENGKEINFEEGPDDIVGDWEEELE